MKVIVLAFLFATLISGCATKPTSSDGIVPTPPPVIYPTRPTHLDEIVIIQYVYDCESTIDKFNIDVQSIKNSLKLEK